MERLKFVFIICLFGVFLLASSFSAQASPYKDFPAPEDLLQDMDEIIKSFKGSKPLVMFQSQSCHFCDHARKDMKKLGLEFKEVDVNLLTSQPFWGRVVEVTGIAGTPQFLVGKKLFLGYSRDKILKELKATDKSVSVTEQIVK